MKDGRRRPSAELCAMPVSFATRWNFASEAGESRRFDATPAAILIGRAR
jgi:hypothetical protein